MTTSYPQEGELVIATVTKIQYHSVFCTLEEYDKLSGMIHISEIAPGRIKNINDYVKEGKSVVAKVLRTDEQKGHIDLSIRRVTEAQRKQKATQRKQESLVNNIVQQAAQQLDVQPESLRKTLQEAFSEYVDIYEAFVAVIEDELDLADVLDKKQAQVLTQLVSDRIQPKRVTIKGSFQLETYAEDGIARIRAAFKDLPEQVHAFYTGAGSYTVEITAREYKIAETILAELKKRIRSALGDDAAIDFERTDKK